MKLVGRWLAVVMGLALMALFSCAEWTYVAAIFGLWPLEHAHVTTFEKIFWFLDVGLIAFASIGLGTSLVGAVRLAVRASREEAERRSAVRDFPSVRVVR